MVLVFEVYFIKGILRIVWLESEFKYIFMMEGIFCMVERVDGIDVIFKVVRVFVDFEVNVLEDWDYFFCDGFIY